MEDERIARALSRIEAAASRIEAAAARPIASPDDAGLVERHAALRREAESTLAGIDRLIESLSQ